MPQYLDRASIVKAMVEKVGPHLIVATPLGIGKPNHLLNDLYAHIKTHPDLKLTLCTALTLQRPQGRSTLEQRFIDLFADRLFGDFPDLDYEIDRMAGRLPDQVEVIEFYFAPGKYRDNADAQRHYISSNYTHVARDVSDRGANVLVQLVARKEIDGQTFFSLSSNPDATIDLVRELRKKGLPFVTVAQVNQNLPFMFGDAMVPASFFDFVNDQEEDYFKLFGPPKTSVTDADYMIGLYCSALVCDDGDIQIGIGALGDSTVYNLLLRHDEQAVYQNILEACDVMRKFPEALQRCGETAPFDKGLFVASEMIVDGFQHLYEHGIVKKRVYDDVALQQLLNAGLISEDFDMDVLKHLHKAGVIHERLTAADVDYLVKWGIFKSDVVFRDGHLFHSGDDYVLPNIYEPASLNFMWTHCMGRQLKNGQLMHGGFFLGPSGFYNWLANLPEDERRAIHMKSVLSINQLYGHEQLDRLHRKNARFINTCMIHTLSGAAASDGLEDGTVISGVGGQYNFVAMAQELPDGHSILNLRSTRPAGKTVVSNIVPAYGHVTIPRHLRDIVVTEYGIAFLRGKTDEEIIKALINVSDSRFQNDLLQWAKSHGKLAVDYEIPDLFTDNFPKSYQDILRSFKSKGYYPAFPLGTDLNADEIELGRALKALKAAQADPLGMFGKLFRHWRTKPTRRDVELLDKLKLMNPSNMKDRVIQKLLVATLQEHRNTDQS